LKEIRESSPAAEYVLIDDLENLLLPERELLPGETEEVARLQKTILDLSDLIATDGRSGERKTKVLVTTTGRFFYFLNPRPSFQRIINSLPNDLTVAYSKLELQLPLVQLNPWARDWRSVWRDGFEQEFESEIATPDLLQVWGKAIADVTGGHPALIGPVVKKLREVIGHYREAPQTVPQVYGRLFAQSAYPQEGSTVRSERLIRAKIEEWIDDDGIRPLTRTLKRIRSSSDALEHQAFVELVRLAAVENGEPPEDKFVRDLLQFEYALIHEDGDTGYYMVPGAYLRTIIRRASSGIQIVRVEPDPQAPDPQKARRGTVYVQTSVGQKIVRLSLGKWRLFQLLFEKGGGLVTLSEIEEKMNMSQRAVQNVVTRLRQRELREVNLEITNERDRGYRLVMPSSRS